MTEIILPKPIDDFFTGTNETDRERFLSAFARDAVIDDWGRTFTGLAEIGRWNDNENMGVQSTLTPTGYREAEGKYVVSVTVSGNGYNGGGAMTFTLDGDLIARVDITG